MTKAWAHLLKAQANIDWMIHHALRLRDKVRDLKHEVSDLKEHRVRASRLECEAEEVKKENDSLKGKVEHLRKIEASLLRVNFELSIELKRALQERDDICS